MGGVTHLLLLLWVGVTVSTAVDLQKRIVRGARCRNTERLYHVKLVDNNNNFVCGGSVITKRWILTSAHCLPDATKVILGVHPGPGEPPQIPVQSEIYRDNTGRQHDIMLWKLPNPTDIDPVKPPDCGHRPRPNVNQVQIAGLGSSAPCPRCQPHEPRTNDLQCANIGVIDCLWITNPQTYQTPHHHMFCGDTHNADACHGDCGGAVLHNNKIYGIIQGGHGTPVCTDPVKFMDVCAYMDWIKRTTARTLAHHSSSVSAQHMLARCRENQSSWRHLNATDTKSNQQRPLVSVSVSHSRVYPCILSALQWISQRKQPESTSLPDRLREAPHVSVLVTGSLYLVGGVLKHLEPSLDS